MSAPWSSSKPFSAISAIREWAERLSAADVDMLEIDQWEAQKSRFRKTTAKGAEVAVSLDRGTYIRDGDVLLWDAQARSALVARIELRDVMVVHLDELMQPRARKSRCAPASNSDMRWATSTGRRWSRATSSMCRSRSTAR